MRLGNITRGAIQVRPRSIPLGEDNYLPESHMQSDDPTSSSLGFAVSRVLMSHST